jgi:hypothetical protein
MIAGSQPKQSHSTAQPTRREKMRRLNALFILCFLLVLASTVRAQGGPGVNNAELNGAYAFTFNGMTTGGGNASTVFASVGRFTADGAGNLANGELDSNGVGAQEMLSAQTFTGTYTIGTDHRGVMTLNIPGGGKLAFAMRANGSADFVEIDASGTGTVGSGTMEKADTTAYNTARIKGDYAFGFAGLDGWNNRAAMAGRFSANGAGTLTNGAADVNQSGMYSTGEMFTAAYYSVSDTTTGRGMMILPPLVGGVPQNHNFAFYVVDAGKLFVMETDAATIATPLLSGVVLQQQRPVGGFSNASINGGMVMYLTGRSSGCGSINGPAPNVLVGLLTGAGDGTLNLSYDENCGGATTSAAGMFGTYGVTSNGRVTIRFGSSYVAAYLVSFDQAFIIVPDSTVLFGFGEPQAASSFTDSAMKGMYVGSATSPAALGVVIFCGEFTADGASPTGNISGVVDIGAPNGPSSQAVNATYSVSTTPTNGRGTLSGNLGGSAVVYVVSPSEFVVVSFSDTNPAVLIFEQ